MSQFHPLALAFCITSAFGSLLLPLHAQSTESVAITTLIPGLGNLVHPVSTKNTEAQKFFNQGLTLVYAFNHDAAYQSFKKASELDPDLAMAYWGMALSIGQNINMDVTKSNMKEAYKTIQKALKLSSNATKNEQAYINALATRYSDADQPDKTALGEAYFKAMKQVSADYPEDLDAATLWAESGMDLHPWKLWDKNGQPIPGTLDIVAALESVLQRNPNHIGANHYYIHAVEASPYPQHALMSAERLETLLPASGHFLHMPAHIYIRVGDYHRAALVNEQAVAADKEYIQQYGLSGVYPIHYLSHNYFFLIRAYMLLGNEAKATVAAKQLYDFYVPNSHHMLTAQGYALGPVQVALRFQKWQDIIDMPLPPEELASARVFFHYARALAYLSLDRIDLANKEKDLFLKGRIAVSDTSDLGYNTDGALFAIAELSLNAKFARAENKIDKSIALSRLAIEKEDDLFYNEPPDWANYNREVLGATLILQKRYKEAAEVFKADLEKHPLNGRSLFGLKTALIADGKETDGWWVNEEFETAWQYADTKLTVESLLN